MKIVKLIAISTLASAVSLAAMAGPTEEAKPSGKLEGATTEAMPMMGGQQGGMPMMKGQGNMPKMEMMQEKQAMMQAHMKKMETHMANIEALLKQLVELHKK